jgi:hypothetical protein
LYLLSIKKCGKETRVTEKGAERGRDWVERIVTCPTSTSTCNYSNINTFGTNVCTEIPKILFLVKELVNGRKQTQTLATLITFNNKNKKVKKKW